MTREPGSGPDGWYKSTFSKDANSCVEIAHRAEAVLIRDNKYIGPADDQPIVSVRPDLWSTFLDRAVSTSPAALDDVSLSLHPAGGATVANGSAALVYSADEWDAFTKGIADGQFDRPSSLSR